MRNRRHNLRYALGVTALAIVFAGSLLSGILSLLQLSVPLVVAQSGPISSPRCPGDAIGYTVTLKVESKPAIITRYVTLWSVDRRYTVQPATHPEISVMDPGSFTRERTYIVPTNTVPGRYEVRIGISAPGHTPATYAIPFTVTAGCRHGE